MDALLLRHQIRMLRGALPGSDAARLREELRRRLVGSLSLEQEKRPNKSGRLAVVWELGRD